MTFPLYCAANADEIPFISSREKSTVIERSVRVVGKEKTSSIFNRLSRNGQVETIDDL